MVENQFVEEQKWRKLGSNQRPSDLQSDALPTELLRLSELIPKNNLIIFNYNKEYKKSHRLESNQGPKDIYCSTTVFRSTS
jgi:dTDP-4-amino-4,6-dideoxygalactose transaminase